MTDILIIEKNGNIKTDKILNTTDLYKKCGFRKADGFENIINWNFNINNRDIIVELWGRKTGKTIIKNSYIFPIELDKIIYGNCLLIGKYNTELIDLSIDTWNEFCYKLNNSEIDSTNKLETIDVNSVSHKSNMSDISNDEEDSNSISDTDSDDNEYNIDSELQEESYIYSSEEEEEKEKEKEEEKEDK